MKKLIAVSILVFLAIALVFSTASAQPVVTVNPFRASGIINVPAGTEVIIEGGWGACRRGLIQTFLNTTNVHFTIDRDGSPYSEVGGEEAHQHWGPIYQIPNPPWAEFCIGNTPENGWGTNWTNSLGVLESGE